MRRKTITIPDEVFFQIQKLRGERISDSNHTVSFSRQAVELMEKGLEKVKEEKAKGGEQC